MKFLYLRLDNVILYFFKQQFSLIYNLTCQNDADITQTVPVASLHIEHSAQFLRHKRQERLKSYSKISRNLHCQIKDCVDSCHIGLCQFPRFGIRKILITDTRKVHSLLQRVAETESIEIFLQIFLHIGKLFQSFPVIIREFPCFRHNTIVIFMRKYDSTVDEITEYCHKLVIIARLEIFPCEVVILGFRSIGRQDIAQHVLLAGQIAQIFVQPYSPVTRSGNLITLKIQKFICRYILRQLIRAFRHQHCRKDNAMEYNIILSYEIDNTRVIAFPIFLPRVRQKFLCVGNIAYRGIEPHIKHFSLRSFYRDRHAPVQIAAHRAGLQPHVKPRFALSVDIRLPFLVLLKNPFAQFRLPLVQRQIPVFCLLKHRLIAGYCRTRVYQVGSVQRRATRLALVAVGMVVLAMRTSADNITVGKELMRLFIVILHRSLFYELSFVVKFTEKVTCRLTMDFRCSTRIYVKRNTEFLKRIFYDFMIAVHYVLRCDTLFFCFDGNRHTMLVRTANHYHILPFKA